MTAPDDFTRSGYERMLVAALGNYRIGPVSEYGRDVGTAIWRHDVDCSPQAALAFARIEAEKGVRATYYFNIRSDFYNLLEVRNARIALQVASLGHEIGLHLDFSAYRIDSVADLERVLEREKSVFRALLDLDLQSFSFHNPDARSAAFKDAAYAGLLNAYSDDIMGERAYCSDSNGYWRYTPLDEFLSMGHSRICVLTHPEWWPESKMSPRKRITRCVEGRAAATLQAYDELLATHGRKNVE
jgi:hypothetical protein